MYFFRLQAEPLTKFVDSIYGKAILLFLLLWLLTEEHYTISICIIISIISTLYWIREKRDYELVKYTINTEPSKGDNKCKREAVQYTEAERKYLVLKIVQNFITCKNKYIFSS